MTEDQRAAIERLRKLSHDETLEMVYASGSETLDLIHHVQDLWKVVRMRLSNHPADGLSAADELCEARRLLKLCRPVLIYRDQRELNAFLDRTSRFEK